MHSIIYKENSSSLGKHFSYILMLSIIFDISTYFYGDSSNMPMIRGIIIYGYVFFIINKFLHYKQAALNLSIILLLLYWLILIPFSSKPIVSLNFYSKAVFPFIILFIVNNSNSTIRDFKYFFISFSFIILASILFFFIVNLLGINNESYVNSEVTSYIYTGLSDGKLYAQAVAIILFPFIWYSFTLTKKQKYYIYILLFLVIVFSIISVRRTTYMIIILGTLLFYYFSNRINLLFKVVPSLILILLLSSPLWISYLKSRIELRANVYNQDYSFKEEGRYMETIFVLKESVIDADLKRFFIGKELFNSSGIYGDGVYGDRKLHVDYINILFSSGAIGVILYIILYIVLLKTFLKKWKNNNMLPKYLLLNLKGLFISMYITSIFISFSGQMYEMTFRTMLFGTMGIIISILNNSQSNKKIKPLKNNINK